MRFLKFFIFFMFIAGVFIGYGETLGAQEEDEEVLRARPRQGHELGSEGGAAAALKTGNSSSPAVGDGRRGALSLEDGDEERLIKIFSNQEGKFRAREDFFRVTVPSNDSVSQRHLLRTLSGDIQERIYTPTCVKRRDKVHISHQEQEEWKRKSKKIFERLKIVNSEFLGWPDSHPAFDAGEKAIESTHLLHLAEGHTKTPKEYFHEGICWVGKHTVTLSMKGDDGVEVVVSGETDFSPTPVKIACLYYMRISQKRTVSILFGVEAPYLVGRQFVYAGEDISLEPEALVGLPNWRYWTREDPPLCYDVNYFPGASTYKYGLGWKEWIGNAPEFISLNHSFLAWLGHFRESFLIRGKERSSTPKGILIGFNPEESGFYENLYSSFLEHDNFIYLDPNRVFHSTKKVSEVWRREGRIDFISVVTSQRGPHILTPYNFSFPALTLSAGFYEVKSTGEAGEEIMELVSLDKSRVILPKENPDLSCVGFELKKIGEENGSLEEIFQIAQQPHVMGLAIENFPIPLDVLPGAMERFSHLRRLILRNCFERSFLTRDTIRPAFNILRKFHHLEELDVSQNKFDTETFRDLLFVLVGMKSQKLTHITLSLPEKPSAITSAVKASMVSYWTITQVEPLIYAPYLEALNVLGVRRNSEGCALTKQRLDNRRKTIGTNSQGTRTFSSLSITLYATPTLPEEDWEVLDAADGELSRGEVEARGNAGPQGGDVMEDEH